MMTNLSKQCFFFFGSLGMKLQVCGVSFAFDCFSWMKRWGRD
jgi:hypothetical protein